MLFSYYKIKEIFKSHPDVLKSNSMTFKRPKDFKTSIETLIKRHCINISKCTVFLILVNIQINSIVRYVPNGVKGVRNLS